MSRAMWIVAPVLGAGGAAAVLWGMGIIGGPVPTMPVEPTPPSAVVEAMPAPEAEAEPRPAAQVEAAVAVVAPDAGAAVEVDAGAAVEVDAGAAVAPAVGVDAVVAPDAAIVAEADAAPVPTEPNAPHGDRAAVDAVLSALGPPAPAECRAAPGMAASLLGPAAMLAGGKVDGARPQDVEAAALLEKLPPGERDAERTALLARARLFAGDGDGASVAARLAIAACPGWATAHNLLGNAEQKVRRFEAAEAAYAAASELDASYLAPRFNGGLLALRRQDGRAAAARFSEVLALDPAHPTGHLTRGQAWLLAGQAQLAVLDLEEATRRRADDASAWMLLGQAREKAGSGDARAAYCRARALGSAEAAAKCAD